MKHTSRIEVMSPHERIQIILFQCWILMSTFLCIEFLEAMKREEIWIADAAILSLGFSLHNANIRFFKYLYERRLRMGRRGY